ncbi:MAG: DUF1080 domain-containing protein [Planctomycetota bacterium]
MRLTISLATVSACVCSFLLVGFLSSFGFGQEAIFNGRDLSGWKGDMTLWSVEDGAITGKTTAEKPLKENSFLVWEGELEDFELSLNFRIVDGNSGIQFRSQSHGEFKVGGYQADIDAGMRYMGILYDERGRGILAERGEQVVRAGDGKAEKKSLGLDDEKFKQSFKSGEWNTYTVRAEGNHITQTINGMKTVDFTDKEESGFDPKGILALQIHTGPPMKVQFKDVVLKPLDKAK